MEQGRSGAICPVCGYLMTRRVRARAQEHLAPEFVCWNMDCLDFGLYRHAEPSTTPSGPVWAEA